jgi:hypothetical protein
MNLVADESVDRQIVERLRQDGHHAVYIAERRRAFPMRKCSRRPIPWMLC